MHRFTTADISEDSTGIADSTLCYFDVELPGRTLPGHAIVDVTDVGDPASFRDQIATLLNAMVAKEGAEPVIEALASVDGLRVQSRSPAP